MGRIKIDDKTEYIVMDHKMPQILKLVKEFGVEVDEWRKKTKGLSDTCNVCVRKHPDWSSDTCFICPYTSKGIFIPVNTVYQYE